MGPGLPPPVPPGPGCAGPNDAGVEEYRVDPPPGGIDPDAGLLLVALRMAITRSRDTHSALCESIGDYAACRDAERDAWREVWQAITDRPLADAEFEFLTGYPVPKEGGDPCRSC